MKIKAIIQNHHVERIDNISEIIDSLNDNGVKNEDIIVISDYPASINHYVSEPYNFISANFELPIAWWHGVGAVLKCDYVALVGDDLKLKKDSIDELVKYAELNKKVDVFGYEGGNFAKTDNPYTDDISHLTDKFTLANYIIRFHFVRPLALVNALKLFNSKLPFNLIRHDDLILSLSNTCGLVPTTETSGFEDMTTGGVGFSKRREHYSERNELIRLVKKI